MISPKQKSAKPEFVRPRKEARDYLCWLQRAYMALLYVRIRKKLKGQ